MAFGLRSNDDPPRLSYSGYLKISELTSLQRLESDPPQHDEMLFIIIHQVYELWFKELLHEVDSVIALLLRKEALGAHRLLRRCLEIEQVLVTQVAVLETMTPMDFLTFRDNLMPASGFQSAQFREIEIVSGLKEARVLDHYAEGSAERKRLELRLSQPTLQDAFYELLTARGFNVIPENGSPTRESGPEQIAELVRLYEQANKHYDLFMLAEALIEYDELILLWRLRHVKMVERMIGSKTGTGGSDGAAYLNKTVERRFFPDLWELRTYLSNKSGGCEDAQNGGSHG